MPRASQIVQFSTETDDGVPVHYDLFKLPASVAMNIGLALIPEVMDDVQRALKHMGPSVPTAEQALSVLSDGADAAPDDDAGLAAVMVSLVGSVSKAIVKRGSSRFLMTLLNESMRQEDGASRVKINSNHEFDAAYTGNLGELLDVITEVVRINFSSMIRRLGKRLAARRGLVAPPT